MIILIIPEWGCTAAFGASGVPKAVSWDNEIMNTTNVTTVNKILYLNVPYPASLWRKPLTFNIQQDESFDILKTEC